MKTKLLLTGAGGNIGVHFIAHIMHNTDWDIVATDSFRHKGTFDRITEVCKDHQDWLPRIKIITHDLTAPFTEREVNDMGKITHIIHLASLSDVQDSIDNPVPFIRNNIELELNMLELARKLKPETFIQFSTDEVYGQDDKYSDGHPEWDVILPSNPYAASKASQEAIAISYWRTYGVPVIITNTMNNFGEMQSPSKYTAKIQNIVEKGEVVQVHSVNGEIGTRYYLHSRNAADAVLFILANTTPTLHKPGSTDMPDRYNIVGDAQIDNLELAKIVARLMGKELKYELVDFHSSQPGHDMHYGLNGKKLSDLGWVPPVDFETSMLNTIKWQQKNNKWI